MAIDIRTAPSLLQVFDMPAATRSIRKKMGLWLLFLPVW